jgi:hypothetical protein
MEPVDKAGAAATKCTAPGDQPLGIDTAESASQIRSSPGA